MKRGASHSKLESWNIFNFLGGSFSNGDNVRVPIQFRRES